MPVRFADCPKTSSAGERLNCYPFCFPDSLKKIFNRLGDEDDLDDAEEARDERENRITPDA